MPVGKGLLHAVNKRALCSLEQGIPLRVQCPCAFFAVSRSCVLVGGFCFSFVYLRFYVFFALEFLPSRWYIILLLCSCVLVYLSSCLLLFLRSCFLVLLSSCALVLVLYCAFLSEITLVIKRLVKRETINVKFELPGGTRDHEIKAGSNLRGEMIRLDVPVSFRSAQNTPPRLLPYTLVSI